MDAIQKPVHHEIEIIPYNILNVANFYQTKDLLLRGKKRLKRPDGTITNITNTRVEMSRRLKAHNRIVGALILESDRFFQELEPYLIDRSTY